MTLSRPASRLLTLLLLFGAFCALASGQGVKRIVIVKMDGLPGYYVDRFVKERDPKTGRSVLPWIEEVFYRNGTRVPNFYTRGMSLSGPAWGQLDTGQRLQIKGNVEYDRYTLHPYDYLNFFPYYMGYGLGKKVDMPAVEVMDQLGIPIMSDAFPYENRYTAHQLYQRGNDWGVLANGFLALYPGDVTDFLNEWSIGLKFRSVTIKQTERDILAKLEKRQDIDYFDYYDTEFDHVSHHNNDKDSRLTALKQIDGLIGRIWTAIRSSSRADETALALISDHGFNSTESAYSQGFNIVKLLSSVSGGAHHVVTKRRLMLDYSVKGLYPLTPIVRTVASDSYYLKGKGDAYPTALVDFDGNERTSIHLRNSDLNMLQILHQQLTSGQLAPDLQRAVRRELQNILARNAPMWTRTAAELTEELGALKRWTVQQELAMTASDKKNTASLNRGEAEKIRRAAELTRIASQTEKEYRDYLGTLNNLISLNQGTGDISKTKIEDIVAPGSMGEPNSLFELQNYIVGLSPVGLVANGNGELDLKKSFTRLNYFDLLHDQKVRNNVQLGVGNRPIDMVAVRLPLTGFSEMQDRQGLDDPVWLYGGPKLQALLLTRTGPDGKLSYRYQPISGLTANENGTFSFEKQEMSKGFPLGYFEDPNLLLADADRASWLTSWHAEDEWMSAVHKTHYSNGIIGLNEHLQRHPLYDGDGDSLPIDQKLLHRFRQRQRYLTEADMLVVANDHWNFDVRGFNPGGNHGSFFRASTNSTFMIAGGEKTGVPRGMVVDAPYDSLSFAPTIFRLMGKVDENNNPTSELRQRGFRRFPGRVIRKLTDSGKLDNSR